VDRHVYRPARKDGRHVSVGPIPRWVTDGHHTNERAILRTDGGSDAGWSSRRRDVSERDCLTEFKLVLVASQPRSGHEPSPTVEGGPRNGQARARAPPSPSDVGRDRKGRGAESGTGEPFDLLGANGHTQPHACSYVEHGDA